MPRPPSTARPRAAGDAGLDPFVTEREVSAADCAFAGRVATGPDGRSVLLVDREALEDWPGWSVDGEEHVLGALDIVRRLDGHDVVFPSLVERVDDFLARRDDAAPLSVGEAVTVAVSALRGLASAEQRGTADGAAEWWLTDEARPLLVEGVGTRSGREASADIVRALSASSSAPARARAFARIADLLADPSADAARWDAAEDDLFATAAAEPLELSVLAPARTRARRPPDPFAEPALDASAEGERGLLHALSRRVDAGLADAASDAWNAVLRRLRRPGGRRRPLLVAVGLAVVVVVAGLAWPSGDDPSVAAPETAPVLTDVPAEPADPMPTRTDTGEPSPAAPEDAAGALARLLDAWHGCAARGCVAEVFEEASLAPPEGAVRASPSRRTITLVDDLGGLAVLRVEDADRPDAPQLVTVVKTTDGWRVRDVYDATDPPSPG
jgi:hypothetical protein